MFKDRKKVTLCGSTRFSEAFQQANLRETVAGRMVYSIGCDMKSDDALFAGMDVEALERLKEDLDQLHFDKISDSDEILVLNVNGYVGYSTFREIFYAVLMEKEVRWLEPEHAFLIWFAVTKEEGRLIFNWHVDNVKLSVDQHRYDNYLDMALEFAKNSDWIVSSQNRTVNAVRLA